ncbi:hypothetical protein PENTCL1PPCAC_25546, partial [Pristionchus entomophagus]
LKIASKSTCKRCVSPIPLSRDALDSIKKNVACLLLARRTQEESYGDCSFDPSSLATRHISLLLPYGPDSMRLGRWLLLK